MPTLVDTALLAPRRELLASSVVRRQVQRDNASMKCLRSEEQTI